MVTVLKTVVAQATVGSNPTPSAILKLKCLIGWQMWLHGVYIIDVAGMEADLPTSFKLL